MDGDCKKCKKHMEHLYWDHRDAKGKCFCCVMEGDFTECMKLPKKFISKFNGKLSNVVRLKSPGGNIWNVEMTRTRDGVILQSGWVHFVEAHDLEKNDLLVFRYDGNSCFDIVIFDGSNCEKEASYFVKRNASKKRGRSENSVQVSNVPSSHKVTVCSSSRNSNSSSDDILQTAPSSIPHKKIAKSHKHSVIVKNKQNMPCKSVGTSTGTEFHTKQESVDMHHFEMLNDIRTLFISRRAQLTHEEKEKVLQLVNAVRPDNPSFVSIMRLSSIGSRNFLTVPSGFATAYLPSKNSSIFFEVPGQRKKWSASFNVGNLASGFGGQWKLFVLDNNLVEGDVCLFEMATNGRPCDKLTVNIARAADHSH